MTIEGTSKTAPTDVITQEEAATSADPTCRHVVGRRPVVGRVRRLHGRPARRRDGRHAGDHRTCAGGARARARAAPVA
jgi:hypothetical protein